MPTLLRLTGDLGISARELAQAFGVDGRNLERWAAADAVKVGRFESVEAALEAIDSGFVS